jgi:hypothetical protein
MACAGLAAKRFLTLKRRKNVFLALIQTTTRKKTKQHQQKENDV